MMLLRFYIYSRKSRFTGKGESVENQVQLAKEYIARMYGEAGLHEIEVFEDEGFSGKNLDRPEFQRMMSQARKRKCDYVVCYRLDRISRNVSDFSSLLEEFEKLKISFVCIKEQFDTSTPMGRAMMYIASVFAQLERETIAERIRDNMLMLARTGRWLGGMTPLGFASAKVAKETIEGKVKTSFKLSPIDEEMDTIKLIFGKFLALRSLTKVETFLMQQGIKTRKNKDFTIIALREILTNPVYCVANQKAYEYFTQKEADVCSDQTEFPFDGKYGIAAYNRTKNEANMQRKNPVAEWIVTVGRHKGIIESEDWISVQKILESNQPKKYAGRVQNPVSLLSGLVVCADCGSFLRPRVNSNKRRDEQGFQTFAYLCERKKKSKGVQCDIPNINGNKLDQIICDELLKYDCPDALIHQRLAMLQKQMTKGGSVSQLALESIRTKTKEKRKEIDALIHLLSQADATGKLFAYTAQKVEELDREITKLRQEEYRLEQETVCTGDCGQQAEIIFDALKSFSRTFKRAAVPEKRAFLKTIIEKVIWDGKGIHIFLFGEPPK